MSNFETELVESSADFYRNLIYRYFSFWPYFLISNSIFLISAFIYLRYSNYEYLSISKLEVYDKAQDSEMALPTSTTIFNRSLINLQNEIGKLQSYKLHRNVVDKLGSNVKYYSSGKIKITENHSSEWITDYDLDFKIDLKKVELLRIFEVQLLQKDLIISEVNLDDEIIYSKTFKGNSTKEENHDFPFELTINEFGLDSNSQKVFKIFPFEKITSNLQNSVVISEVNGSDQLELSLRYNNRKIADEYLNNLMIEFDKDGILDRQLGYKRTIDFVDTRSEILLKELQVIENQKQEFKEKKNFSDIKSDAAISVNQKINYNSEIFKEKYQKDLIEILENEIKQNKFKLVPVNIGIEDININKSVDEHNSLIKEWSRLSLIAGSNNQFFKNLTNQIESSYNNILSSINNFKEAIEINIKSLELKENEFNTFYKDIPENEKLLRSIERELEIKESLFLLLLQKKEEAAINYAVIKPSIKIIDYAKSSSNPVRPKKILIISSALFFGLFFPFATLYVHFAMDNKIHVRDDVEALFGSDIPLIGEIPFLKEDKFKNNLIKNVPNSTRSTILESFRMVIANLKFLSIKNKENSKVILVTSSVKGEGKTLVAANLTSCLAERNPKVILLGCDLRNPQLHKFFDLNKDKRGITDYLYNNKMSLGDLDDLIINKDFSDLTKYDFLLSGTIPPNPTELLASEKFNLMINHLKKSYDYIIIDSAPCLLVSDTFEISNVADFTLYVIRSNHTEKKLSDFIKDIKYTNKLNSINLILNSVGNSASYGYKYGYQYGYKYGYRYGYSYNYGYGYGYGADK